MNIMNMASPIENYFLLHYSIQAIQRGLLAYGLASLSATMGVWLLMDWFSAGRSN